MANTSIQPVATTTQFDGTAGKGLVDFAGAELPGYTAVIYSIGYNPGAGTSALSVDLVHPDGAASGSVDISGSATTSLSVWDGRIVVPKADDGVNFELQATSTSKTGNGTLVVTWGVEKLEG